MKRVKKDGSHRKVQAIKVRTNVRNTRAWAGTNQKRPKAINAPRQFRHSDWLRTGHVGKFYWF